MKKALKITGLILWGFLGAAVAAILVIAVFFPGLPAYIAVKLECPEINSNPMTWDYKDAEIPGDFIEISEKGMTLSVPSEMKRRKTDSDIMLYWDGDEETERSPENVVMISGIVEDTEFDALEILSFYDDDEPITEDELRDIFSHVNMKYPGNYYEYITGIYNLNMEDFNIHSYAASSSFVRMAQIKENSLRYSENYICEINGVPAIIYFMDDEERLTCSVELFAGENCETQYMVTIGSTDMEAFCSMIASIEIST